MGKLTDEQKIQIVNLYNEGNSSTKLGLKFGIAPTNILSLLRRREVSIRPKGLRKYYVNDEIFNRIDTEEKAYWLGFICADGHVSDTSLVVEINGKDILHLEKMKKFLQSEHVIRNTRKNCVILSIGSGKLVQSLRKLGLQGNKTKNLKTPKIDESLLRHFYRGAFDGDGWITSRQSKNTKSEFCSSGLTTWEIGMSSGSTEFIHEFHNWICRQVGKKCGYLADRNKKNQQVWQLTIGGNKLFSTIVDIFYKDVSVYLERKHERYKEAKNNIKTIIEGHRRFTRPLEKTSGINEWSRI